MRVCLPTRLLSSAACKRPQTSSVSKAFFKRSVDWPSLNAWHPSALCWGLTRARFSTARLLLHWPMRLRIRFMCSTFRTKKTRKRYAHRATCHQVCSICHWAAAFQLERRGRRVVGARCIFESVDKQKPLPRSPGMAIFSRHASPTTKSTGALLAGL